MNQTFFISYFKEDFSAHGINDILHLPVTEETMNQVLLKWARHKTCEGKEMNHYCWKLFAKLGPPSLHPILLSDIQLQHSLCHSCIYQSVLQEHERAQCGWEWTDQHWPLNWHTIKKWSLGAIWLIATRAYPDFCSMKRLGVFFLLLDGMLVHRRSLPAIC